MLFLPQDHSLFRERGIREEVLLAQIHQFIHGRNYLKLERPCTVGDGILQLNAADCHKYLETFEGFRQHGSIMKLVPASGAASRMFRHIYQFNPDNLGDDAEEFILHFRNFPFVPALEQKLAAKGISLNQLINDNEWQQIFDSILKPWGLGYMECPKGVVIFHRDKSGEFTAFEEHLYESIAYARDGKGQCRIHFTIPPEQENLIRNIMDEIIRKYPYEHFDITYSTQSPSTDLPALTKDNMPARDQHGNLIIRPAGHGALLSNLAALDADVVFIKNIDNVTTRDQLKDTVFYKKALAGLLIEIRQKVFNLLDRLDSGSNEALDQSLEFIQTHFQPGIPIGVSREQLIHYARTRLDRPLRVCGMVRNEGEPGGGPFWVKMPDGQISKQIVEKNQVDLHDVMQSRIADNATHFNPVDIVCSFRNRHGEAYALEDFVDHGTGIVTDKFHQGKVIRALELPGLWNGSMALWNTLFCEVPVSTFNPVKTVNDLLRSGHQSACNQKP
ncbi:MAG: hypothetical protein RL220_664 [Bacteroidota bacterium]